MIITDLTREVIRINVLKMSPVLYSSLLFTLKICAVMFCWAVEITINNGRLIVKIVWTHFLIDKNLVKIWDFLNRWLLILGMFLVNHMLVLVIRLQSSNPFFCNFALKNNRLYSRIPQFSCSSDLSTKIVWNQSKLCFRRLICLVKLPAPIFSVKLCAADFPCCNHAAGMFPVRWMAPESLSDGIFRTSSDIWSYGILLYEIMTFGSFPYQGLSNRQVLAFVKSGQHILLPRACPPIL